MRVGTMIGDNPKRMGIPSMIEDAQKLEDLGLTHVWLPQIFGFDALGVFALLGRETSKIHMGTDVVPMQPRHPVVMAQQGLTAQAASNGRFILGIGLSHKMVIEGMFGLSYDKPAKFAREYLSVMMSLIKKGAVSFKGDFFKVNAQLQVRDVPELPVVLAALGPMMLKVAGEWADGTTTWMTGEKTLAGHIIPGIRAAAQDAGRSSPRVVVGLPIVITDDAESAAQSVNRFFQMYPALPSYKAMMDREGVKKPAELALIGTEDDIKPRLEALEKEGMTDFVAAIATPDDSARQRTLEFLATLA